VNTFLITYIGPICVQIIVFMLLWLLKQRLEKPDILEKKIADAAEKLEKSAKEKTAELEADMIRKERDFWDALNSIRRSQEAVRGDVMWIKGKINGVNWKTER